MRPSPLPSPPTPPLKGRGGSAFFAGLLVLVVGILLRLGLWLGYAPVEYSDTRSYRRLAEQILSGWQNYDGSRTPGYPALLALVGPDERVYALQLLLGLGTAVGGPR